MATSINDEKFQMHADNGLDDHDRLIKSRFLPQRRLISLSSFIYPLLLALLLLTGTVLLILTITRRSTCRLQQAEQAEALLGYIPDDRLKPWLPCTKTGKSACACPASFVHSSANPAHCIPNYSRCLVSCRHNLHCSCHNLVDPVRCRIATRNWLDNELTSGPVERLRSPAQSQLLQKTWMDNFNRQLERLLVDMRSGERLYVSSDHHTGIAIHEIDDDYLLNERWTKIEVNTTRQHIVYTQLNPQTHTCRMSLLRDDGTVSHGAIHSCPGSQIGAPYFLGAACNDVLVLWRGSRQFKIRRSENWTVARHHFESVIPRLPVLLDPFHRYYSLYDDSMVEIKDLNGDVAGQFFTDIVKPSRFEFLDHVGSIFIANQTHMQIFRSTNEQSWLDF